MKKRLKFILTFIIVFIFNIQSYSQNIKKDTIEYVKLVKSMITQEIFNLDTLKHKSGNDSTIFVGVSRKCINNKNYSIPIDSISLMIWDSNDLFFHLVNQDCYLEVFDCHISKKEAYLKVHYSPCEENKARTVFFRYNKLDLGWRAFLKE